MNMQTDIDLAAELLDEIPDLGLSNLYAREISSPIERDIQLSSDLYFSIGSSSISRGGAPGRTKNAFTHVLDLFRSGDTKKSPKKEFFNAFIIRAIKRAFRCVISNKVPKTTCIQVDQRIPAQARNWTEIGNIYRENPILIEEISKTENGPETDGKPKRKGKDGNSQKSENISKSFNNSFCKSFFSEVLVQRAFNAVIEIMFSEFEPEKLKKRFSFRCCSHKEHGPECESKWTTLKDYFDNRYFKDLEVISNYDPTNSDEIPMMIPEF
jgi:hypothetical protein